MHDVEKICKKLLPNICHEIQTQARDKKQQQRVVRSGIFAYIL